MNSTNRGEDGSIVSLLLRFGVKGSLTSVCPLVRSGQKIDCTQTINTSVPIDIVEWIVTMNGDGTWQQRPRTSYVGNDARSAIHQVCNSGREDFAGLSTPSMVVGRGETPMIVYPGQSVFKEVHFEINTSLPETYDWRGPVYGRIRYGLNSKVKYHRLDIGDNKEYSLELFTPLVVKNDSVKAIITGPVTWDMQPVVVDRTMIPWTRNHIICSLNLPVPWVVRGEAIPIEVDITNDTLCRTRRVSVTLWKEFTFVESKTAEGGGSIRSGDFRSYQERVSKMYLPAIGAGQVLKSLTAGPKVPPDCQTSRSFQGSRVFSIRFFVRLKVQWLMRKVRCDKSVFIGTYRSCSSQSSSGVTGSGSNITSHLDSINSVNLSFDTSGETRGASGGLLPHVFGYASRGKSASDSQENSHSGYTSDISHQTTTDADGNATFEVEDSDSWDNERKDRITPLRPDAQPSKKSGTKNKNMPLRALRSQNRLSKISECSVSEQEQDNLDRGPEMADDQQGSVYTDHPHDQHESSSADRRPSPLNDLNAASSTPKKPPSLLHANIRGESVRKSSENINIDNNRVIDISNSKNQVPCPVCVFENRPEPVGRDSDETPSVQKKLFHKDSDMSTEDGSNSASNRTILGKAVPYPSHNRNPPRTHSHSYCSGRTSSQVHSTPRKYRHSLSKGKAHTPPTRDSGCTCNGLRCSRRRKEKLPADDDAMPSYIPKLKAKYDRSKAKHTSTPKEYPTKPAGLHSDTFVVEECALEGASRLSQYDTILVDNSKNIR